MGWEEENSKILINQKQLEALVEIFKGEEDLASDRKLAIFHEKYDSYRTTIYLNYRNTEYMITSDGSIEKRQWEKVYKVND